MKAIILAAGEGKRMQPLENGIPKCLLLYDGEPIIKRLINQIKKCGVNEIIVVIGYKGEEVKKAVNVETVFNTRYKEDVNIYSLFLALDKIMEKGTDDVVVFESDMIAEDEFVKYVLGTDFENKSVWFTEGKFQKNQHGSILKTDGKGNVIDLRIVYEYQDMFEGYDKLTGVLRISANELTKFYDLIKRYKYVTLKQYYLIPWIENLDKLPCVKGDASHYIYKQFNTKEEYLEATKLKFEKKERNVEFVSIDSLYPIEKYDSNRLEKIKLGEPLKIEKTHNLILDGHHRYQLAKRKEIKDLPVIKYDYNEVEMWSLREEIHITKDDVIKNALKGNLYPIKTVKHKF